MKRARGGRVTTRIARGRPSAGHDGCPLRFGRRLRPDRALRRVSLRGASEDLIDEYVDLIAERAVQLGGIADGTARQVAARSSLDEYAATGGGREHVRAVAAALAAFGRAARAAIDVAADAKDQDSSDIFTEISRGTDKWLWMVEAHGQAGEWARGDAAAMGDNETPAAAPERATWLRHIMAPVLIAH
jgi:Ferritin-like domain